MSDARLRELERRWRESGSLEDEAAYLVERVRVGVLGEERVRLAAYLGYPAASKALNQPRVTWTPWQPALHNLRSWSEQDAQRTDLVLQQLSRAGPATLLRRAASLVARDPGAYSTHAAAVTRPRERIAAWIHGEVDVEDVQGALRRDLVPWALGYQRRVREPLLDESLTP